MQMTAMIVSCEKVKFEQVSGAFLTRQKTIHMNTKVVVHIYYFLQLSTITYLELLTSVL
jgi:hypothetical protein